MRIPVPAMERARRGTNVRPASFEQLRRLRELAAEARIEVPLVIRYTDAEDAIARLEKLARRPTLW